MLSITGLPAAVKKAAGIMAQNQHACLMDVAAETFQDGTVRRTLATHAVFGVGGMQPVLKQKIAFEEASKIFCKTIREVVTTFAEKLADALTTDTSHLITSAGNDEQDKPYAFNTC